MTEPTMPPATLSKEERAMLIKILFAALQVPPWTKDDLISLGKVIFAKTDIRELAEKDTNLFNRLLPHFAKIVDFLWDKIVAAQNSAASTAPPAKTPPAPTQSPVQPAPVNTQPTPVNTAPAPVNTPPAPVNAPPAPVNVPPALAIVPPAPASAPPALTIVPPAPAPAVPAPAITPPTPTSAPMPKT